MKKTDYVGKLFINKTKKDGKIFPKGTTYLRGTVGGISVVAFPSKDGESFNVKKDEDAKPYEGKKSDGPKSPF